MRPGKGLHSYTVSTVLPYPISCGVLDIFDYKIIHNWISYMYSLLLLRWSKLNERMVSRSVAGPLLAKWTLLTPPFNRIYERGHRVLPPNGHRTITSKVSKRRSYLFNPAEVGIVSCLFSRQVVSPVVSYLFTACPLSIPPLDTVSPMGLNPSPYGKFFSTIVSLTWCPLILH